MPPRRSHKKSRAGCKRCKVRKIKCDEVHPQCGLCVKHGVECDFENPELADILQAKLVSQVAAAPAAPAPAGDAPASPLLTPTSPASSRPQPASSPRTTDGGKSSRRDSLTHVAPPPSPSQAAHSIYAFPRLPEPPVTSAPLPRPLTPPLPSSSLRARTRLMELRLMHHYTTHTCKTISFTSPSTSDAWKVGVPAVAFSGVAPYLTDAMLAVAALHLRSLLPGDQELVEASHRYMALSLGGYSRSLGAGITAENAEALFLAASLIAFQSSATRIFVSEPHDVSVPDEFLGVSPGVKVERQQQPSGRLCGGAGHICRGTMPDGSRVPGMEPYGLPLSLFHSFQGVKTVTATAWPFLRGSAVVTAIINSQPMLRLNITADPTSFFGGLLDGLEEELASDRDGGDADAAAAVSNTRQAYLHAVAVLNWAHRIPHKGAALVLPATVSRRFVELLEARRPRALAILACFFALLRTLDDVWWLHGVARKEVLGIISLFDRDSPWWARLAWAVRVALYEGGSIVPPDIWGAEWEVDDDFGIGGGGGVERGSVASDIDNTFVSHVEILAQMVNTLQDLQQYNQEPAAVPIPSVLPMDLDFSLDEIPLD